MFAIISKPAIGALLPHIEKNARNILNLAKMSTNQSTYETLSLTVPKPYVYHVELNRPQNLNAMNPTMWEEIEKCFQELNINEECRSIILTGAGKIFSAGIDLKALMQMAPKIGAIKDVARKAKILNNSLTKYQKSITSLELCRKPVLVAAHSACVGGGINLITAADMRYCTKDAWFQVKEVDIGMAADVGVLQRLPKIVGSDSFARELCYTARKLPAEEALSSGLVSKVFDDRESMINGVIEIAEEIAKKSPVAVQGTKVSLVYSRDHTVQDGLDQIACWNQAMQQSEDFINGVTAQLTKQPVEFSNL